MVESITSNQAAMLQRMDAMKASISGLNKKEVSSKSFSMALKGAIDSVNTIQNISATTSKRFIMGDPNVSMADVMMANQKSSVAFEATKQVRSKVMDAYSQILNMQL